MQFAFDFTIPVATTITNPYTERLKLDTGTLTNIRVRFRAGCHNRVYIALFTELVQIAPAHETQALYGDNMTFDIPMSLELNSKPFDIIVKGWSPETRYAHTISLWFSVIPTDAQKRTGSISNLLHLLGGSS